MPSMCLKCDADLAQNEDILECSICKGTYHYYCAGYSEHNFKKMSSNTKGRFTCENSLVIKQNSPKSNNPNRKTGTPLENNIEELMRSVSFMSKQFDNVLVITTSKRARFKLELLYLFITNRYPINFLVSFVQIDFVRFYTIIVRFDFFLNS